MSSILIYFRKDLREKVMDAGRQKFGNTIVERTALILLQNHKTEYEKMGIDVASDVLDFVFFDQDLVKIGVVKRSDIKKLENEGSGQ